VQSATAGGSQKRALETTTAMIQANPNLKGIFSVSGIEAIGASMAMQELGKDIKIMTFDTPAPLLDMIKNGEVWATGGQNTYLMGYFAMICLYHVAHDLINPLNDWKENPDVSPLPPFINTGLEIVTQENVDHFYLRE
jgi:ribose transport system substrate-binding protein